jgi:hypothetical protein
MRRLAPLLVAITVVLCARAADAGVRLDPFGRGGARSLDPFRVSQAQAAPVETPAPKPAPAAAAAPKACASDAECPNETICEQGTCQAVPTGATNILYLYYREGTFREILGLYWSKRGPTGYTVLAPLYWHFWNPQGSSRTLLPFFVSTSSNSGVDGFTWVLPLNFFWKNKEASHQLVIPFYYRQKHATGGTFISWFGYTADRGKQKRGSVLWLYWFGEDKKEDSTYDVVFPLVWDFREHDSRTTVAFPLVWRFRTGETSTTIAGPWVHLNRPTWTFDAGFLLWWAGSDKQEGTAFKMLIPVFYWKSANQGRRVTWVSPIGGYGSDEDQRSKTLALLPILTFWRRDPETNLHIITPFFVRQHSTSLDATTYSAALLAYRRTDPQGTTTALAPVFWRFWDKKTDASATVLFPFFAHRSGPRDTTTAVGVFPLFAYWRDFKGGGWSAGLFPLAFFGENRGSSHGVVFPLFWRVSDAKSATTVFAPFVYWRRDEKGSSGGVPIALTFWGERAGESYAVQFPLFWRFTSASAGTSTTATPLGYYHRDRDGWSLGVGPVVPLFYARSGTTRSHAVLFPLFWRFKDTEAQKTTTVVGPYYHRSWGDETTDGLFPLFHYRRGTRPGGPTDEKSLTIFPLFHYHRDQYTNVLVTPLYASAQGPRRSGGFAGPFIWYRGTDVSLSTVPLLYTDLSRKSTGERTRQWGPFFQVEGPGRKARVLFPLFGRYVDERETGTFVFPSLYFMRRNNGDRVDAVMPLFWRSQVDGRKALVVGLFYDQQSPGVHNTGLFPLWFHASNPERKLTTVPLLLYFHRTDYKTDQERLLCLLLWYSRNGQKSTTTFFPLLWAGRSETSSYQVVFPVFWRFTDDKAQTAWTLAGPLYWSSNKTERTRGLLPLFWYSRDAATGSGSMALMPLFYEGHGPGRKTVMTPLFGYKRSAESNFTYAGPVLPLWVKHTNLKTETETQVMPPLLYFSRSRPDSSIRTFLALFWRRQDVTSATTLALPLFFDVHDYNVSRTTLLLPLFVRHADYVEGSSTLVAPLFYRRWAPTSSTTVLFPLFWDWKTAPDHRTTIFAPLFAHWRRPGYASTWVFPTIYHSKGLTKTGEADGTWHTVVAPFYATAVKRPGDFMWEILGGLVGHERVGRNRYLKLFFMRFEQDPVPRAQTAWYSKPAPVSRRKVERGLSFATW